MKSDASMATASIYTDFSGLTSLKARARSDQKSATAEVARQFESMFLQMMLKSMRKASLAEGLFDGETLQKYRDMYDQQLSVHLAESGGVGLASVIERQLAGVVETAGQKNRPIDDYLKNTVQLHPMFQSSAGKTVTEKTQSEFDGSVKTFVDKLKPFAQKAAAVLGIQPEALLAQAALETGWGKSQMKLADGKPSFNLFGIKADSRWDGKQAAVSTLEFRDGIARREKASFRAYDSYQQAFDDYAQFITGNSRYRQAVKQTDDPRAYFSALQQAGYATDPEYANKIMSIFRRGEVHQAFEETNSVVGEES